MPKLMLVLISVSFLSWVPVSIASDYWPQLSKQRSVSGRVSTRFQAHRDRVDLKLDRQENRQKGKRKTVTIINRNTGKRLNLGIIKR